MASRLHIAEPSIDNLEDAEDVLRNAQHAQPPQSREAAGLQIAAAWVRDHEGEIDGLEERRLELAFARISARIGSEEADPMELDAVDYARTILVDVSIQREAEAALQIMDILDRRDHYSWLSSEHAGKPWHSAEIAPTEFMNFAVDDLAVVASGRFSDLPSYHREGVEVMLIQGMSRRDDDFDRELHGLSAKLFDATPSQELIGQGEETAIDLALAEDLARKREEAHFGFHPNEGGLRGREIEGVADRLSVARHADLHRDHSVSLYDPRPGRNPFAITQEMAERGKNAVRAAMDGFKRNRVEKGARVALEFQQERGIVMDRPAFERMERAAARLIRMPDVGELSDLELAKVLIVDSSIQKIASDKLNPQTTLARAVDKSASMRMLDDMLGRGTVPVFTRLASERDDTQAVAYGRFHDLTDNRGIGSMVRQAIYRSGQDVGGATGAQLERINRSIRIGGDQERGWIDRKADRSAGASQLQELSHGPARYRPQPAPEGLAR
jgi:hypothetical protein